MNNTIHWGFAGTPATFTTPAEKFEVTVSKMRTAMNIHPEHEILILNHAANQPIPNDGTSSDSDIDNDIATTVPEVTETPKSRKKAL
jgi:hypothetical protein